MGLASRLFTKAWRGLLALTLAGCLCLLYGCQGKQLTKALAEMDQPEVEVHRPDSPLAKQPRPRIPLIPASETSSGYGGLKEWNSQPRLEAAALVEGGGSDFRTGSVVPFMRSELSAEDASLLKGEGSRLFLKAKPPASILAVEWVKTGAGPVRVAFGESGTGVVQAPNMIRPGEEGQLKVTLRQVNSTAGSSVVRTSEDRSVRPRYVLREIGKITSTVRLKLIGEIAPTDRPEMLFASDAFGHRMPVKNIQRQSDGISFEMSLADYQLTLTVSVPEERTVTLVLPVKAEKPARPAKNQAEASRLPLFRLIHEDPNKMHRQANSPA